MSGSAKIVALLCVLGLVMGFAAMGCSKPGEKPKDNSAPAAAAKETPGGSPTKGYLVGNESLKVAAKEVPKPAEAPQSVEAPKPAEPEKPVKPGTPELATIHKCAAAPTIDGDLSDACWKNAEVKGVWADVQTGKATDLAPKVYMCYDDKNLYVAFLNPEPKMDKIVAVVTDRDGTVYSDDSDEVFIDPSAGKHAYYHVIVNAKGVIYDARGKDAEAFNGNEKVAVKMLDKAWALEFTIPLKDIGVDYAIKGETWTANFCRNRQTEGAAQAMAWSDTGETFHNPAAFGKLKFE
jgi:hypothetical protein